MMAMMLTETMVMIMMMMIMPEVVKMQNPLGSLP